MKRALIVFLSLAVSMPVLAAEGFSSLEEQMTGREFSAAGLDKLSNEELQALNDWIRKRSLATLDTPKSGTGDGQAVSASDASEDRRGLKSEERKDREPINSRLVGAFSGWDGQTVFELENGMIWAQADKDKFFTKDLQNPEVVIKPGMFGSWKMQLVGYDSECKVKRIQ